MKLLNITRGPVTLSKINYEPRRSEETSAFEAMISINGMSCNVHNDGCGGANHIFDRRIEAAVSEYAKTLPPEPSSIEGCEPLDYDADFLVSMMIGDAIEKMESAKEDAKMAKKGFTHRVHLSEDQSLYIVCPTEAAVRAKLAANPKHAAIAATVKITQIADPEVARRVYLDKQRTKFLDQGYTHAIEIAPGKHVYVRSASCEAAVDSIKRNPQYAKMLPSVVVAVPLMGAK